MGYQFEHLGKQRAPFGKNIAGLLLVQSGANDRNHKMGKVRSALIQLKPANNAVVGKVFCDPSFRDTQVFGELWLDGIRTSAARAAAQKIPDGDPQGLTRLDIVITGQIGVGQNKYPRAHGRVISLAEFDWRASKQAAKLHFEK